VALSAAALVLLLQAPSLDVRWEHQRAHLWLVLAAGAVNFGLGLLVGEAARRRADARSFFVSLVFLASAGFLVLHALATPGVFLTGQNAGFTIAAPIGLLIGSAFAALSTLDLSSETSFRLVRRRRLFQYGLFAVLVAWAVVSLVDLPPLEEPLEEPTWPLRGLAIAGLALYALAAVRYLAVYRRRPAFVLLAVVAAFALLAEAMFSVAFSRNWHASWWEWHLLMLVAFAVVALAMRREWRAGGSLDDVVAPVYGEPTLGEVRDVSALFADLQGFTAFSERSTPEEVSHLVREYFESAVPGVVREHRPLQHKRIGDAVMLVFDRDGHAKRAALAGLALQRRAAEIVARHPDYPRLRVGVNSGEAHVGMLGETAASDYTALGDTVNLAARLEASARPGEVVVGEATWEALGRPEECVELAELEVKGKARPVRAFVLAPGWAEREHGLRRE